MKYILIAIIVTICFGGIKLQSKDKVEFYYFGKLFTDSADKLDRVHECKRIILDDSLICEIGLLNNKQELISKKLILDFHRIAELKYNKTKVFSCNQT